MGLSDREEVEMAHVAMISHHEKLALAHSLCRFRSPCFRPEIYNEWCESVASRVFSPQHGSVRAGCFRMNGEAHPQP